jgi:carbonic anhydrase
MSMDRTDSPGEVLDALLAGNDRHVARVDGAAFDAVRDAQHPPVVSVCCSDSRVSQEGMWDVSTPGELFTVANIGNRATARVDGERVLDGGVAYPTTFTDTGVVVIVGHTGCGAITTAYDIAQGRTDPEGLPPGVRQDVAPLVELVEHAPVALDGPTDVVVDRLVEHHVREQVAFVASRTAAAVYGFVYDIHRRYGDCDGRTYLVATGDGDPAPADAVETTESDCGVVVQSLL